MMKLDRYTVRPGTEAAMRNLQKQMAVAMARCEGPHPCLALESLTGPKEVWHLSGCEAHEESDDVWRAALDRIDSQIRALSGGPATVLLENCRAGTWQMGRGRYLAIGPGDGDETVYETSAGVRYRIATARTRKGAEAEAAAGGAQTYVFAVRPAWGMPAAEWIEGDPIFWNSSPLAKLRRAIIS